jgi:hypothetical protein
MAAQTIPNFFIAGAPKAGTTSLYHQLAQHPDVYMSPVKEPCFFCQEVRPENFVPDMRDRVQTHMEAMRGLLDGDLKENMTRGIISRREDYLKLFAKWSGQKAIGEGSVFYLWSKAAAKSIAVANPAAKFIIILRHPAERAFSQYIHAISDAHVSHGFSQHITEGLRSNGEMGLYYPFLNFGMYSEQIDRYLDHFPRNQLGIWLYEDTLASPQNFFREVLTFLGVDPSFIPDSSRRYYQLEVPKALGVSQALRRSGIWRGMRNCTPTPLRPALKKMVYRSRGSFSMSPEDRRFLIEYYRDDIRRLEHVIERDLSAWLR